MSDTASAGAPAMPKNPVARRWRGWSICTMPMFEGRLGSCRHKRRVVAPSCGLIKKSVLRAAGQHVKHYMICVGSLVERLCDAQCQRPHRASSHV
jgi:hypothetical protein